MTAYKGYCIGLVLLLLGFAMPGCSSDSSSKDSTTDGGTTLLPAPTVTGAFKQLLFNWPATTGATTYALQKDLTNSGTFIDVVSTIAAPTTSATMDNVALHEIDWGTARFRVQSCVASTCSPSAGAAAGSAVTDAIGYLKASNTGADAFGGALAISQDGNTLAVGAFNEASNATGIDGAQDDDSASGSGAVYVFVRSGATWSQEAYIKASNAESSDSFGYALALSSNGDTLAVGAPNEASVATGIGGDQSDNTASNSGAVYVFTRSGATWSQEAYIKADNAEGDDQFGYAIGLAADGNTLAVSAPFEDSSTTGTVAGAPADSDAGAANSGAVYVFTRSGSTWSQQAYVKASNTELADFFGWSLSLSEDGNTLAVGANYEDSNATGVNAGSPAEANNDAQAAGAAYVFVRATGTWSQQAYIKASNTEGGDYFASALVLSRDGDTLAVGAYYEDGGSAGINGSQDNNLVPASGAVYVYTRTTGTWSQQAYIKATNPVVDGYFGHSLAANSDGNLLIVGAFGDRSGGTGLQASQTDTTATQAGAAYVFVRSGSTWSQRNYVKASNTRASARFGFAMGLSGDGANLAVGSQTESSNATGFGGDQADASQQNAGAVYLY